MVEHRWKGKLHLKVVTVRGDEHTMVSEPNTTEFVPRIYCRIVAWALRVGRRLYPCAQQRARSSVNNVCRCDSQRELPT